VIVTQQAVDLVQEAVAAEVRAQLARKRLSGVRAARALGWTQRYLSRRMTGEVPFTASDLVALANLLEVPITTFFATTEGLKTGPTSAPRNHLEDAA
jgi:transcriptional regulator with XRE-family HTH domain